MQPMPSLGYNSLFASSLGTSMQKPDSISSVSDERVTLSFDFHGVAKAGKTGEDGREKGAVVYCAAEHTALSTHIAAVPDSFNAS
jgi:hypothetical protein